MIQLVVASSNNSYFKRTHLAYITMAGTAWSLHFADSANCERLRREFGSNSSPDDALVGQCGCQQDPEHANKQKTNNCVNVGVGNHSPTLNAASLSYLNW